MVRLRFALWCIVLQVISYSPSGENDGGGKGDPTTPSKAKQPSSNSKFASFQTNYLIVFTLAMFSDWLQGPYVYELYVSYGFTLQQIAELFVCGFGSSMIVALSSVDWQTNVEEKYVYHVLCDLYICLFHKIGPGILDTNVRAIFVGRFHISFVQRF